MEMISFEYKGKTALVTGANRGIGEAYVNALINAGVKKIYAAARDLNNLEALVKKHPEIIVPVLLDVTKATDIHNLANNITSLDILINNAGIANACSSTADNTVDIARLEMETNYFSPMQLTLAMLPLLKQSTSAAVINVCSIAAISNFPSLGPYSATKAAMHSFTQGLRTDLASENIRVVGVYPGPIDTRMAEGLEMDKPKPEQVALKTFEVLSAGGIDVMPDDFSEQMYAAFLSHPHELEKAFAQMQ